MSQHTIKAQPGRGAIVLASVLGLLTALLLPFTLVFSALILILLYRWAGKIPLLLTASFILGAGIVKLGSVFIPFALLMIFIPVALLLRAQDKPFFSQMRMTTGAFVIGTLLLVGYAYLRLGGNLIERTIEYAISLVHSIPEEEINFALALTSTQARLSDGLPLMRNASEFYATIEQLGQSLIPALQYTLPGALLCSSLLNGVVCTWTSNRMNAKRGTAVPGSFVPGRQWALPGSASLGLTMILVACYLLHAMSVATAYTALQVVLDIMIVIYCIQALASLRRHSQKLLFLLPFAILMLMGGTYYIAIYGYCSALFGSRGAITLYIKKKTSGK